MIWVYPSTKRLEYLAQPIPIQELWSVPTIRAKVRLVYLMQLYKLFGNNELGKKEERRKIYLKI
jgi:hypothetical protein